MDNNSIKANIRKSRKKKGYTQEELANRLGMSLTAYRDLEKGSTNLINSNLQKIAELTETTTEEIVLGYIPEQAEGKLEDIQSEYGSKVVSLETRIGDLERIIESLEETISSKNDIIDMLKKSIVGN